VLTSETKRRLDACRDLLVGKLPLPTDQVELITLALIYKFMDDLDEESVTMGGKRSFFTGPLAKYRWRALLPQTVSGDERVALFSEGVEAIGNAKTGAHLPELFRDIFRNAFLKFRDGRILTLFLNEVNGFAYSHSEELGNAFEYLLQCMGTQGENGQFRTPRHIIDWIVACLDPQPTDRILDPACGTGGFLVSAYRHILQKHTSPGSKLPGDQLGHEQRQRLYANFTGYDITDLMVKLSKVNLFLHQFPSPAIHIYDSLSNDARWSEKADLILANPPFMTPKGGVTPHTKFRVPAKKAEVLFTDYIAEHLTPDGRAGVIVPNGIVATTQNAYVKLRRFLVEDSLVAVVSLPAGVFKPYSGVKTSILLLDKKLARRTGKILFLKIAADGFDLGDQRREIEANDLPEAERLVKAWLKGELSEDFVSPLAWKFVEKRELLVQASSSLQAEVYFAEAIAAAPSELVKLGDVATMGNGGTPLTTNAAFWKGDIPWVSPKDMKSLVLTDTIDHVSAEAVESSATKLLPAETVLCVVRSGILQHTLPVGITSRPMCTNQDILAITPDASRLNPRFLLHLLRCRSAEILRDGIKTGVTVQSFHNGFFKSYEIPLPPLDEQRRIVAEIEGYQQVIDGARQILAAYRIQIAMEPGWDARPLSEVCEFIDYRGRTPEKSAAGIPLITAKNVRWGMIDDEPREFVTEKTYHEFMTRGFAKRDDVLFTTEAPLGMAALVDRDDSFALAQRVICLSPNPELVLGGYLFRALLSASVQESLKAASTGSTVLGIKASSLKEIKIPLPPLTEQRQIVAELDAEAAQIESVRALIPRYEAKIQRVLARVWGTST
jgi:type I restriction enzyme M protein